MIWLDSITDTRNVNLGKLREIVRDGPPAVGYVPGDDVNVLPVIVNRLIGGEADASEGGE